MIILITIIFLNTLNNQLAQRVKLVDNLIEKDKKIKEYDNLTRCASFFTGKNCE